jgi:thiol-disulfide isomerase/thioredoxin
MKLNRFRALLLAVIFLAPAVLPAQPATNGVSAELRGLVQQVRTKIAAGKNTEKDFAPELQAFDALLARHAGENNDGMAQVLYMEAMLYIEVLNDPAKGKVLMNKLKNDYPDTKLGKDADRILQSLEKRAEAKKTRSALKPGAAFPDFHVKDLTGQPLSVGALQGKVVLVDFWATWCGPCVAELPNVMKAYDKHHGDGFEIIGISLDSDKAKLDKFTKDKKMTWQQFFDGQGWGNKLAGQYGVNSIPATYLLDGEGKIIAKDLRGDALEAAVAKALAKK